MSKVDVICELTKNKDKQFSVTLNYKLIRLFREACKENKDSIAGLVETWILKYLESKGYLED